MIELEQIEHRFVDVNGIRMHIALSGPQGGPLVILLHGFPEFWWGWRKQIPALAAEGFRVCAPDLRGYNLTDKPRALSAYRLDVLARDVVGLIDALGSERVCLTGHDWGGALAWTTAVLHPQRVERLAVINGLYPPMAVLNSLIYPQQLLRSTYIYFFQLPAFPEAVLRTDNWEMIVRGMRATSQEGTFADADFDVYRQAWWRRGAMTGMLNWYRALLRRPVRLPLRPRLGMPVLLLWGGGDVAQGRELALANLDLCEQGKLVYFAHATHWLQHEEPEAVNSRLTAFFAGDNG